MTSVLTALWLLVAVLPAAADPAGPTNYTSQVTGVDPPAAGVDVAVRGGDAFVELRADEGTDVEVAGYDGEPYLRFRPDGTVERNDAAPTRWLNDARYGAAETTVPPEASADAPPRWEVVAAGGVYAWHDHRVHWMSPELPPSVDPDAGGTQPVTSWELPITVAETPTIVAGQLEWHPGASPLPALAVVVALLTAGIWTDRRRPALAPVVPVVGALAAAAVGVTGVVGLPPGADAEPALVILPAVTLVLVGVALAVRRRGGLGPQLLSALAGVPLLVWSVLLIRALTAPVVPTSLPDLAARLLVAVALGAGLASLVTAVSTVLVPVRTAPTSMPA